MKTNKRFLSGILCVCSAIAAFAPQQCPAAQPYFRIDAGANLLEEVTIDFAGSSGIGKFDTGYRVDLAAGFQLNRWAAVELETGWLENSIEHSHHSWMGQAPLLVSFVARLENESPFVPYIGVGAGGALSVLHARISTPDGLLIADNATAATFAYQAMAGVAFKLDRNMELNVGYKFLGTAEQRYEVEDFDSDLKLKDIQNHFIGASFTWKF